jgi:hypothetical protein
MQPVVDLRVYSDESPGWDYIEDLKEFALPCEIDLTRLHMALCSCPELPERP